MADPAEGPACPPPYPVRGQIITYVPSGPTMVPVFSRGVATGAVLTDPVTGSRWLPVIQPDLRPDLVDFAQIVVFSPAKEPNRPFHDGHGEK